MSQVLEGAAVQSAKEPQLSTTTAMPWWQWLAIVAATGYLYYDILLKLINDWYTDPNFSHGFLVPLFSVYVVWSNKEKLAAMTKKPSVLGVIGILGGLSGLIVGTLGSELFVARTSLIFL